MLEMRLLQCALIFFLCFGFLRILIELELEMKSVVVSPF